MKQEGIEKERWVRKLFCLWQSYCLVHEPLFLAFMVLDELRDNVDEASLALSTQDLAASAFFEVQSDDLFVLFEKVEEIQVVYWADVWVCAILSLFLSTRFAACESI